MAVIIQLRHDTAANWSSTNPILADGETGYDSTNNNFRVGDGVTAWNSLVPTAGGGGSQDLADVLTQGNDAGGAKIINLDDPDNPQDAVTKAYADTAVGTVATNLSNHISDSSDAHAASAITNTPAGSIAATTIQAAVDELDSDIQGHISDTTDAHDASAISFSATGGISATDVQAAIVELDTEKAPLASPAFTGNPTAPTPSVGDNDTSVATTAFVTAAIVGVQDMFVPAAAMWPRATGGCADLTKSEMATSIVNIQTLDFDQTTQEFAQFQIALPRKWNVGTVTAEAYWTAAAGTGTVQFGLSGGAYSNDDALTVALGTAQTMDDTLLAANDLHITPTSSAITLAGTPANTDFLVFQLSRNPASDTLTADAKFLGIMIHITTTKAIDS